MCPSHFFSSPSGLTLIRIARQRHADEKKPRANSTRARAQLAATTRKIHQNRGPDISRLDLSRHRFSIDRPTLPAAAEKKTATSRRTELRHCFQSSAALRGAFCAMSSFTRMHVCVALTLPPSLAAINHALRRWRARCLSGCYDQSAAPPAALLTGL